MIKETSTRSFDEDATDTTFNVEGLDFGYYLVCQTGTKEIQSSLVPVVSATATVNLKTQAPDITKTADKDATTVHVGQTVTYTITGQVPDMTGYSNYVYKIHDTLTNGLDFVTNEAGNVVVTVKIGEATYNDVVGAISKDNERNMTIDLSEKVKTAATGAKIEVTYQAKVNKNAVVETKNSATLEYSNKPGTDATGTTKPSEVVTPTYPLDVKKTDTKDIMLAGAHFKLYASTTDGNIDKNAVIKVTKDVENTDGEYTYAADQSAGAIRFVEREAAAYDEQAVLENQKKAAPAGIQPSQLAQWPCQIKLVPVNAPYFQGAKLLIAADCTAYAYANVHQEFMRGKVTIIGCPKLDDVDYSEKLTQILENNDIKSVTILCMEVPCCGGLEMAAKKALKESGKFIPWQVVTISIDGKILD